MVSCNINILVLGMGNEILTDDGIGSRLVNEIENEFSSPLVHFETTILGGMELLEVIEGYSDLIVVDAIITRKSPPGTLSCFTSGKYKDTLHLSNEHNTNFLDTLKLGKALGMAMPFIIRILAIEVVEDKIFGEKLSPALRSQYHSIKGKVTDYLTHYVRLKKGRMEYANH